MDGIEVQVTDDGPATFEVVLQDGRGRPAGCDPDDLRLRGQEIGALAFGLVRPLPAGATVELHARARMGRLRLAAG
jgi:hypothetical protein